MLNRFIKIIICIMALVFIGNVKAITTDLAKESIDISKTGDLTINYQYSDYDLDETIVKVYKIASFNDELQYELTSSFLEYPIKVNGLKSNQEWDMLKEALLAYIYADSIVENYNGTINDNMFTLSNLELGLYLVETDEIDNDDYTLNFDSFLVNIPNLEESGYWNYDVNVYPKASEYVEKNEMINYKVLKQWKNDGKKRPDSITIEIYKDSELIETKILSDKNNWLYEWEGKDDGSKWSVVERNVPNGYTVSILYENNIFNIINDASYEEENPKTVDNINLYFYLLGVSVICLIIIIICLYRKKKNR